MIQIHYMVARADAHDPTQASYSSRDFGKASVETLDKARKWVTDTARHYATMPVDLWSVDATQDGKSVLHWRRGDALPLYTED